LWNNLSYSLYLVGDYPTAKTYMNRALELDPGLESARSNLALVFVRETDYEKALATIRKTKNFGTAYTTVGYLAYRVGEFAWAEELLEQAIGWSPTYNKPAHDYLAATRRALAQEVPSERPDQEVKSRIDAYAKLLNGGYSSWEASRLVSRAYGVAQSETLEALEKYSAYLSEVLSSPRPLPNS
jgi:tetratricopeptide (TPR) repeat protein